MGTTNAVDHNSIDHDAPFDRPLLVSMVEISYEEAMYAINAAVEKCRQLGIACCLCVTDTHGFTVSFARMDGARHMTEKIATGRAKIAAYWGQPSKQLRHVGERIPISSIDDFENNGATQGGMPLFRDGKIIGGIGCSGGHGVEGLGLPDDEVARQAAKSLEAWLSSK